jgi:dimethylhistidine N-methyltransferase
MSEEQGYRVLTDADVRPLKDDAAEFALEVLLGLSDRPKRLPSKYFYDDAGSRLFQRIMGLSEYYLTACETQILEARAAEIVSRFRGKRLNLVDLGAGDGKKTKILIAELEEQGVDAQYVPIDISEGAMKVLLEGMSEAQVSVPIRGLVGEYADGLRWINHAHADRSSLVLFLGSNIGNFNRAQARSFLRQLWNHLRPEDSLLVGFDLKKDIDVLLDAYNDGEGVTAEFNKNLLTRINRELGANFDVNSFRHYGTYDVHSGAMVSYLVSLERQRVEIGALDHAFEFAAWEPVHTEYSYKYLPGDIEALASDTGFFPVAQYFDDARYFTDCLWRVKAQHTVKSSGA